MYVSNINIEIIIVMISSAIDALVKDIEALNDIEDSDNEELPPLPASATFEKELTNEELEGKKIYETAAGTLAVMFLLVLLFFIFIAMLNKIRPDKTKAYQLLIEASNKGNLEAKALVAWAKLFGTPLKQDILVAKEMFKELAEYGNTDGHMGMGKKMGFI